MNISDFLKIYKILINWFQTISSFCCSLLWDFYLVVFQPHILFISNVVI